MTKKCPKCEGTGAVIVPVPSLREFERPGLVAQRCYYCAYTGKIEMTEREERAWLDAINKRLYTAKADVARLTHELELYEKGEHPAI